MLGGTAENHLKVRDRTNRFQVVNIWKSCSVRPDDDWLWQRQRGSQERRCCGCTGGNGQEMLHPTRKTDRPLPVTELTTAVVK